MNKIILITGASGFIGRALTKKLLNDPNNIKILLLSRSASFEEYSNVKQIIPVIGDINNVDLLVYILKTHEVTHVYHLASEAIISESKKNLAKGREESADKH
jgi:nucleoside-diphosphate-sugar epimerase